MSSILDQLSQQIGPTQISQMANRIGATPEQTETAVTAALPTLLAAVSKLASNESGAAALQQGLLDGKSSGMLDQISGMLGGVLGQGGLGSSLAGSLAGSSGGSARGSSAASPASGGFDIGSIGSSILGQVLGGNQSKVEQGIGKASGLDTSQISSLLGMLAPMLLGAVRNQQQAKNMNPGQLSDYLQGERKQVEAAPGGSMIGRMLDQDGDGDFDFQDIVKLGMKMLFGKK